MQISCFDPKSGKIGDWLLFRCRLIYHLLGLLHRIVFLRRHSFRFRFHQNVDRDRLNLLKPHTTSRNWIRSRHMSFCCSLESLLFATNNWDRVLRFPEKIYLFIFGKIKINFKLYHQNVERELHWKFPDFQNIFFSFF